MSADRLVPRARAAAARIARSAGDLLMERFGSLPASLVRSKGEKDLVTEMDERAQELIVAAIRAEFPDHGIHAEEALDVGRGAELRWVVDPLDGTTNYVHGYPLFSVSIALERRGAPVAGAVYAPALGEMFDAGAGEGASRNGEPIAVSRRDRFEESLLATGFACVRDAGSESNVGIFAKIVHEVQGVRRGGSAALDLAYVAMGRFEGFWELNLSAWDTAAGVLLVREAGGTVTDFDGGPGWVAARAIVASNGLLHEALLAQIRAGRPPQGDSF